jgi:hypothetical protein
MDNKVRGEKNLAPGSINQPWACMNWRLDGAGGVTPHQLEEPRLSLRNREPLNRTFGHHEPITARNGLDVMEHCGLEAGWRPSAKARPSGRPCQRRARDRLGLEKPGADSSAVFRPADEFDARAVQGARRHA